MAQGKDGRNATGVWRGIAADVQVQVRVPVFVAIVACIAAMSITHLGMLHLDSGTSASMAFLHLTIVPVALAALLFGLVPGIVVGLFAGVAAYAHAALLPANYYEQLYIGPLGAIVSFVVAGLLFGLLYSVVDRRVGERPARAASFAGASLAVVVVFNALSYALTLTSIDAASFILDPGGLPDVVSGDVIFSVVIEAAAIVLACFVGDGVVRGMQRHFSDRKLSRVFQGWLLLVVVIVFMVMATAQFAGVSFFERDEAVTDIESEISYIGRQVNLHGNDPADVLDGYDLALDGAVAVLKEGYVVASNDPATVVGWTDEELFGLDPVDDAGEGAEALAELVGSGLQQVGVEQEDGSVELSYLIGRREGAYTILISWPLSKVYVDRPITMAWTTLAILVTLVAVFLLATFLLDRVVVRRIVETNDTLGRITDGDLNARVNIRDSREFSSLSAGVNTTVSALRDAISEAEQRNAQELMTAKAIQESSLPCDFPPFPEIDRFDIYASMKTAKEVGGDFYDFFLIADDRLGFVMADVSGKGIPAALFMMTAKTQVRTYMESGIPVGEAIDAANHQLCLGNDAGMFVTLFACVLEYATGRLTYVNAGHNPPLILHDGAWEWMRDVSGMPLGLFEGIPYDQLERQLETGDMLYLYTDGVTEAMNQDGELFGEGRLEQTLRAYGKMNPRSVGVGVRRAITDFTLDCEQSDDITMLALKYGVPPETKAVMILRADEKQLVHVFNYIHVELKRRNAPKSVYNPLDIAAEELFVNVCHYAYPDATPDNPGEVRIAFEYNPNPPSLMVEIADDGIPYNPLEKPDAVTPDDIADVPIGGLGILMAKRSVDSMEYRREGDANIVTFTKGW